MAEYSEKASVTRTELGDILLNKKGTQFIRMSRIDDAETDEVQYDVRRWYLNDDDEEIPTQKGLRLKEELLKDVIGILLKDIEERDKESVDTEDNSEDEEEALEVQQ